MVILRANTVMCLFQASKKRSVVSPPALSGPSSSTSSVSRSRRLSLTRRLTAHRSGKPAISPALAILFLISWMVFGFRSDATPVAAYGLDSRPPSKPYLKMPETDQGAMPRLLSNTGALKNTRNLTPADGLIPYDINVAFYSDGASKLRWLSVPQENRSDSKIRFAATGDWHFPKGTVFVKHFEMAIDETLPDQRRRLETRLLVSDAK